MTARAPPATSARSPLSWPSAELPIPSSSAAASLTWPIIRPPSRSATSSPSSNMFGVLPLAHYQHDQDHHLHQHHLHYHDQHYHFHQQQHQYMHGGGPPPLVAADAPLTMPPGQQRPVAAAVAAESGTSGGVGTGTGAGAGAGAAGIRQRNAEFARPGTAIADSTATPSGKTSTKQADQPAFRSKLSNLYPSGLLPKQPIARKRYFHDNCPIPYNALADPALEEFFARPKVQKHLIKNGWYASHATCASCGKCDQGPIKICTRCQRFFHVCCLPSLPITISNLSVLIIHCTAKHVDVTPVKQMLLADGHFARVDMIDAQSLKPRSPDFLKPYDAVLVLALNKENANSPSLTGGWPEPDTLGDLLADFVLHPKESEDELVDEDDMPIKRPPPPHRGGIVLGPLTHWETIGGRWRKHKIAPLLPGRQKNTAHLVLGKIDKAGHAVMTGVNKFAGGNFSYHVSGAVNEAGANEIARWSNGLPLVVVLDDHPMVDRGRVISLNYWPIPEASFKRRGEQMNLSFWDKTTDGARLLSNALRFVAQPTYQTGEGELLCHDCETGHQKQKVVPKVYEDAMEECAKPNRPATTGMAQLQSMKDDTRQLKIRMQREKVIAELHVLKESFRKKFREQIFHSENRKHTVQSKLTESLRPGKSNGGGGGRGGGRGKTAAAAGGETQTQTQLPDIESRSAGGTRGGSGDGAARVAFARVGTAESTESGSLPVIDPQSNNNLTAAAAASDRPPSSSSGVDHSATTAEHNSPSHTKIKRPVRGENEAKRKVTMAANSPGPIKRAAQPAQAVHKTPAKPAKKPAGQQTQAMQLPGYIPSANTTPNAPSASANMDRLVPPSREVQTPIAPVVSKPPPNAGRRALGGSVGSLSKIATIAETEDVAVKSTASDPPSDGSAQQPADAAEPTATVSAADPEVAAVPVAETVNEMPPLPVPDTLAVAEPVAQDTPVQPTESVSPPLMPSLSLGDIPPPQDTSSKEQQPQPTADETAYDADPFQGFDEMDSKPVDSVVEAAPAVDASPMVEAAPAETAADAEPDLPAHVETPAAVHTVDQVAAADADHVPADSVDEPAKTDAENVAAAEPAQAQAEPPSRPSSRPGSRTVSFVSQGSKRDLTASLRTSVAGDRPWSTSSVSRLAAASPRVDDDVSLAAAKALPASRADLLGSKDVLATTSDTADTTDTTARLERSTSKKSVKSLHTSKNDLVDSDPVALAAAKALPASRADLLGSKDVLATTSNTADTTDTTARLERSVSKKSVRSLHASKSDLVDSDPVALAAAKALPASRADLLGSKDVLASTSDTTDTTDTTARLERSVSKKSVKSLHTSKNDLVDSDPVALAAAKALPASRADLLGSKDVLASTSDTTDTTDTTARLERSVSKKSVRSLHASKSDLVDSDPVALAAAKALPASRADLLGSKDALAATSDTADTTARLERSTSKKSVKSLHASKDVLASTSDTTDTTYTTARLERSASKKSVKSLHASKDDLVDSDPVALAAAKALPASRADLLGSKDALAATSDTADTTARLERSTSKKSVKSLHTSKNDLVDSDPVALAAAKALPASRADLLGSKDVLATTSDTADTTDTTARLERSTSKKSVKSLHASKSDLVDSDPVALAAAKALPASRADLLGSKDVLATTSDTADTTDTTARLERSRSKKSVRSLHTSKDVLASTSDTADTIDTTARLERSTSKKSVKSLRASKSALASTDDQPSSLAKSQSSKSLASVAATAEPPLPRQPSKPALGHAVSRPASRSDLATQ
ncbi:hypothetical protein BC831DRAFT_515757 [Entophlyctis helioformis]|nr:hypothetical protein BC831DRAFT_515757 [Entophlyctis helioformis]